MANILPIILIVAVVVGIIIYAVILSTRINRREQTDLTPEELEDRRRAIKGARIKLAFFDSKNTDFYNALKIALPRNYVIFPRVAVELLFYHINRADLRLKGQYIGFCVFTDKLAPVLAIDLIDTTLAGESTLPLKSSTKDIIRSSGLPVLEYAMRDVYSIDDLRKSIAKAMNPLFEG